MENGWQVFWGWLGRALIGLTIAIQFALTCYLLIKFFPTTDIGTGTGTTAVRLFPDLLPTNWTGILTLYPNVEHRLMIVMLLAGSLGSFTHVATSYTDYVGNQAFEFRWTWWYLLRMVVGGSLALIFYFLLRGGLISPAADGATNAGLNPYGLVAVGALAGMFSKQATDKLREVFDTLFKTTGDERKDKLGEGISLASVSVVASQATPTGDYETVATGAGFTDKCAVVAGGKEIPTTFVSATQLKGVLALADVSAGAEVEFAVIDKSANNRRSGTVKAKVPA